MSFVLCDHLDGGVVVTCAEDGFELGCAFGKDSVDFVFHVESVVNESA